MPLPNHASRWDGSTPEERKAAMADVRAALLAKATTEARERAASLGLDLDDEQAVQAGAHLLRSQQQDRARVAAAAATQKRRDDFANWAVGQAFTYANTLNSLDPSIPLDACKRLLLSVVRDELDLEDRNRPRLCKRLDLFIARANEAMAETTARLNSTLVDEPEWGKTADEYAAEDGVAPWGGITAEDMVK